MPLDRKYRHFSPFAEEIVPGWVSQHVSPPSFDICLNTQRVGNIAPCLLSPRRLGSLVTSPVDLLVMNRRLVNETPQAEVPADDYLFRDRTGGSAAVPTEV